MRPSELTWPATLLLALATSHLECGGDTSDDRAGARGGGGASGGAEAVGGSSSDAGVSGVGGASGSATGGISTGGSAGAPTVGGQSGSGGSAAASGSGGAGGSPVLFMILRFERRPASGFCVVPGQILRSAILYGELGDYWFEGTVFRGWVNEPPDCYPDSPDPDCIIDESIGFALSGTQLAELETLLDRLPEDRCELDPMMECDPCVVTDLEIDNRGHSDYCCGDQLSPGYGEAFNALADFLDSLPGEN